MATKKVIYNGDDKNTIEAVKAITENLAKPVITFGLEKTNDYWAADIENSNEYFSYTLINHGENKGRIALSVPGKHNVYNSLAVIAAAVESGATVEECIKGIADFHGAGRRFEKLAQINGITVIDDYAHHPKELEVTINTAMKQGYNNIYAVFQPFTYSRTSILFDDFVRVLSIPDYCVLTEIMGSREVNTFGIYSSQLAEKIPECVWFNTFDEVAQNVVSRVKPGDLILSMGCGDVYKADKIIIKLLKEKYGE